MKTPPDFPHDRFDLESAAAAWRDFETTKLFDVLAALPLIFLFGASAGHLAAGLSANLQQVDWSSLEGIVALQLARQAAALAFMLLLMTFLILRNPAKAKAKGMMPRLAAFAGTYFGVLLVWLPQQPIGVALSLVSLLLMLGGAAFSAYAISHLGRSFSIMAEGRQLVAHGPYARIRHPLYLGEALSFFGLTLQYLSPLALAIFVVQIGFQLMRMKNEEAVLADLFPGYETYRNRTARLVPGVY
jgi:protein-S-isoprenylcysteine O-methyltransferase Ste14